MFNAVRNTLILMLMLVSLANLGGSYDKKGNSGMSEGHTVGTDKAGR